VQNYESGTPVRVFRGKKAAQKGDYPVYTYEGLYSITGHRMEPSSDGPLVSAPPPLAPRPPPPSTPPIPLQAVK
jgi:hypothetical protein